MALALLAGAMLEIGAGCRRAAVPKQHDVPGVKEGRGDDALPPGSPPALPVPAPSPRALAPAPNASEEIPPPAVNRGGAGVPPDSAAVGPCFPPEPAAGPGVVDPFHAPAPAAAQLNADGKGFYRQGRWEEARQKYRAAEAADPEFLAPALNVACSFVRQERFADALSEVLRLLERAYLPWSEEVLSAADLGALKVRPEGRQLRAALEAGRLRWAAGLAEDLVFVARTRAPLKVGNAAEAGVGAALVLAPRQEVFSWSPRTRRYRQLTSEEGRVLALARSADGRRVAYVTAEKLVRGAAAGNDVALRGVAVEELELGTLSPLGQGTIEGDVSRVEIVRIGNGFGYRVDRSTSASTFRFNDARFEPSAVPRAARTVVSLTGRGVAPAGVPASLPDGCPGTMRDAPAGTGPAYVEVQARGKGKVARPSAKLGGSFGAGMAGLPIP